MTEPLTRLNDQISRNQVGVVTILEAVIDVLEKTAIRVDPSEGPGKELTRVLVLAQEAAGALNEVLVRFETMRDAIYALEDAVKAFDGDGWPRPKHLPEKIRQVLAVTCSAAELEDLRSKYGEAFDFRTPSPAATIHNLNPHKDGE